MDGWMDPRTGPWRDQCDGLREDSEDSSAIPHNFFLAFLDEHPVACIALARWPGAF